MSLIVEKRSESAKQWLYRRQCLGAPKHNFGEPLNDVAMNIE